jgi:hypothetical protein
MPVNAMDNANTAIVVRNRYPCVGESRKYLLRQQLLKDDDGQTDAQARGCSHGGDNPDQFQVHLR